MKNAVSISTLVAEKNTELLLSVRSVVKETEKAFAIEIDGVKNKLAWFPKSVCPVAIDDFYQDKCDKPQRIVPEWLRRKKAVELEVLPWWL